MLVNPYIAGNPVGGSEMFVGRADILRTVLRVLKNPGENAIVLYGQRRIGKTSVLLELMRRLPQEGPYQPIYFDLQDKAALPLNTVLCELMQRIASAVDVPTISNDALPEHFQTTFLAAVLQQLPAETSLVLLLDEFDVLDNPGEGQAGKEFFPYLRSLLTLSPRLQFAFVIGRRPEDLSSFTLSIFKAIKTERISLLTADDTAALVRLSEQNGSLRSTEDAIAQVYALTGGHPFLTQQLCQELWEAAWQDDPPEAPLITLAAVEAAIAPTLRSATNALEWLWDGLRPAQRIVAAALAEAGPDSISQGELESRLQQSGVRILVGELQDAPRTLQDWDLLEPGGEGYRFRVELLRRWLVQNKPLARVQQEIDFVQPAAENLFQAAYAFYQAGQLAQALPLLRQVVALNPNHVRGTLVLSEILLAQKEVTEAQRLLENLYQYHPAAVRPRLVQVLLTQAGDASADEERLTLYEQVLHLEPQQPEAREGRRRIWLRRLPMLEKTERYEEALTLARSVAAELPANHPDRPDLALLERKTQLAGLYQRGLTALKADDRASAIQWLVQVATLEPAYRETTRYLHQAVTGVDSRQLEADLDQARQHHLEQAALLETVKREMASKIDAAETGRHSAKTGLEIERDLRRQREQEVEQLRRQLTLNELPPFIRFWRQPPARFTWSLAALSVMLMLYVLNSKGWLFPTATGGANNALATVTATTQPVAVSTQMAQAQPPPTSDATRWGSTPPADAITGTTWIDTGYAGSVVTDTAVITFVYVPAGPFLMGSSDDDSAADSDEKLQHLVELDAFWIMQTEVTNDQYGQCVAAGACTEPGNSIWNQAGFRQHPVTHVSWEQATQYASWIGGRLPTEAEWEKAARGTDGRLFPWGNTEPDETLLNYNQSRGRTTPVGSYLTGASPYGALDMAGNVWEWVADWYNAGYYATSAGRNPLGPASGEHRVLRGGSWSNTRGEVRAAYRSWFSPQYRSSGVGFRAVRVSSPGF